MRLFFLSLSLATVSFAGPLIVTTGNANTLANALLGPGTTLWGSAVYTGGVTQAGTFSNGKASVGMDAGVVLSSGDASNLASTNENTAGNGQLAALVNGIKTYDAAFLNFNFVPTANTVSFNYVFATTDETNDVFGIFINGIDCASRAPGSVMTCSANVKPGLINNLSFGVADTLDRQFDSEIFIQANALGAAAPEPSSYALTCLALGAAWLLARRQFTKHWQTRKISTARS